MRIVDAQIGDLMILVHYQNQKDTVVEILENLGIHEMRSIRHAVKTIKNLRLKNKKRW